MHWRLLPKLVQYSYLAIPYSDDLHDRVGMVVGEDGVSSHPTSAKVAPPQLKASPPSSSIIRSATRRSQDDDYCDQ